MLTHHKGTCLENIKNYLLVELIIDSDKFTEALIISVDVTSLMCLFDLTNRYGYNQSRGYGTGALAGAGGQFASICLKVKTV